MTPPAAGLPAPAFELSDLEGRTVRFVPDAPAKKVLVFYKNTCPTCQLALPFFDRLYTRVRAAGTWIHAISQDTPEEARAFAQTYQVGMPQLVDPAPYLVSRLYQIMNVPTLMTVSEGGTIVLVSPAFVKAHLLEAARWLSPGWDANLLFSPDEDVPELKPG
jgi:peroxiredoxin